MCTFACQPYFVTFITAVHGIIVVYFSVVFLCPVRPTLSPNCVVSSESLSDRHVRVFCTRPTKNGGSEMCDVLLGGVPGCVTRCDRGEGAQLAKNSVRYFMDGPLEVPSALSTETSGEARC